MILLLLSVRLSHFTMRLFEEAVRKALSEAKDADIESILDGGSSKIAYGR